MSETNEQILKRLLSYSKPRIVNDNYAVNDIQLTEINLRGKKHYLPYNNPVGVYHSISFN